VNIDTAVKQFGPFAILGSFFFPIRKNHPLKPTISFIYRY
jgi:hypothetical protein